MMLTSILNKFEQLEHTTLINIVDILLELGYIKYPKAIKKTMLTTIIKEINNSEKIHVVYSGYHNYYIVIPDVNIHLRNQRIYYNRFYKKYINFIKGENNINITNLINEINAIRLIRNKNDEVKTETILFQQEICK